ncbi:MAG: hypothetical protein ACLTSX_12620 [Collinsella sp.]
MNLTNSLNLPRPFVSAAESDYKYTPKRYSVTALLKGTREAILQRRHDDEITQDVADMVWAVFGSAVHQILQNAKETKTQLKENHLVIRHAQRLPAERHIRPLRRCDGHRHGLQDGIGLEGRLRRKGCTRSLGTGASRPSSTAGCFGR